MKRLLLLLALLLLATACGDEETTDTTAPATTTSSNATTTTAATTTTEATTTTVATTTTAATTTTTVTTTTTTLPPPPPFGFFIDGLGVVDFGATPEEVLAAIEPIVGPPAIDTGWVEEVICPGPTYRGMFWGDDAQIWLMYTTGDLYRNDGVGHLFSYQYKGGIAVPAAPPDLTVGTTVAQLQALHPSVQFVENPFFQGQWDFLVEGDTDLDVLSGGLSGTDPDDIVTRVKGGIGCGE